MFYSFPLQYLILLAGLLIGVNIPLNATMSSNQVTFDFYDQEITMLVPVDFVYTRQIRMEEMALRSLYREFERRPYQTLLTDLQAKATALQLNDWLFAQLIRQGLQAIYQKPGGEAIVEYSTYFLLAKSGYDVRLTYRDKFLHVNVYTTDILYEIPLIQDGNRQYANVSTGVRVENMGRSMYLLDQAPQPNGRAFSFLLDTWPNILRESEPRSVFFQYRGQTQELNIRYNPGLAQLLKHYPLVDEHWYMEAPLSDALQASLVPQLRELLAGKTPRESLEFLVAFTRSAFVYKDDKEVFGENKPMVADELFFYPFSDCEDRSALFYALVKSLLKLPMIVIAYEDHLSIAVAAPGLMGDAVTYEGQVYVFCDPTGPQNSSEIGMIPPGYENQTFEILGSYTGFEK